jgi:uncharacterized membrane protein YkvA (DUF1232 family)
MDDNYSKHYSENRLWEKIKSVSKTAGSKVVYAVLLLFYALKDKSVSVKTKLIIVAALGYFILPTDGIFDLTPLIGYSDDLGVLLFALSQISSSITPEVQEKARRKLNEWFGELDENDLQELEDKFL